MALLPASCATAPQGFIGGRIAKVCDQGYWMCHVTAGCELDGDHYIEGSFPGTRRVMVLTDEPDTDVSVRLFLDPMESPGTELLVQLYEPDCTLDVQSGRAHLVDTDLFQEAGDDRTLMFDLNVADAGEHLLEIYSDASAGYYLVVD